MGWDAFSTAEISKSSGFKLKHKRHREAFKAACDEVRMHADMIDGGLDAGVLDCSDCRNMLQTAFNGEYSVYTDWTPEQLTALNDVANWDFKYSKDDAWAYWSARLWLKTCAELGLGARFSY